MPLHLQQVQLPEGPVAAQHRCQQQQRQRHRLPSGRLLRREPGLLLLLRGWQLLSEQVSRLLR
jgi:hypothetical protein